MQELTALLARCMLRDQVRIGSALAKALSSGRPVPESRLRTWIRAARNSIDLRKLRADSLPAIHYPSELPIVQRKDDILEAIRTHPVVILAGETGSGKTTQIPKICLQAGRGITAQIGCTQPRRVAALSISRRIAEELGVTYGLEVGCKIRFSDRTSPRTWIKVMTDGMLLAEVQGDPNLSEYDTILIDEAHERSLNIDFLLGHLKQLLQKRRDLKLIITSATLDTENFSQAFGGAPVIEVAGRLYPVEVRYVPPDLESDGEGELGFLDATVRQVSRVLQESTTGDVLIFLPGERDIREVCDRLASRPVGDAEVIPLFGRLAHGDQQRVFASLPRRKIVVATNIAETSLTIPGIRYVIDSGLARMSRYSPRTRTKRLPIEPVSQSSADQRKGRSGRVAAGICVRLYSEEDYQARPRYTQPEIQRCNLAEVILRMKAFGIGDIETFPFLNPPQPKAIQAGYQVLRELGALDEERNLTAQGLKLARLPVDPTVGRMILQAETEGILPAVMVIAAGLSIPDPRDRPLEKQGEADQAHRVLQHADSDFLSLLNIWRAVAWETRRSQSQIRKFCRTHFLSFTRMREWRDIYLQLTECYPDAELKLSPASADQERNIHRCILSGLLAHVGRRSERNLYRITGNRKAMIFPGSVLFAKGSPPPKAKLAAEAENEGKRPSRQPEWTVAGEIVETSRLYIRTLAGIQPQWIVELGDHLCRRTYHQPHWDFKTQRVRVQERFLLGGLTVLERWVDHGQVNPQQATEIFIRDALVGGEVRAGHAFLDHNRKLLQKLEVLRTCRRHHGFQDLDQALNEFYHRHLADVSSVHDLNGIMRERSHGDPKFLHATENDLAGGDVMEADPADFPDRISVGKGQATVSYVYAPGEDRDGVTVRLPADLAATLPQGALEWVVPGLREEQVTQLLRSLPKGIRRQLMPLGAKAQVMAAELRPGKEGLNTAVANYLWSRYGIEVPSDCWSESAMPDYLRPRIELLGRDRKVLGSGRDVQDAARQVRRSGESLALESWQREAQRWERFGLRSWNFGDLPERIEMGKVHGLAVFGYPGLLVEDGEVSVRLLRTQEQSARSTPLGYRCLAEKILEKELGWLQKDLRGLTRWKERYVTLCSSEQLQTSALDHLRSCWSPHQIAVPLTQAAFEKFVEKVRVEMSGMASRLIDQVGEILRQRTDLLLILQPYEGMRGDLDRLVSPDFLRRLSPARLSHLPRFLEAMRIRSDRAAVNPAKDRQKSLLIELYHAALRAIAARPITDPLSRRRFADLVWLVEEFKVSCYAQELGTSQPVSSRRLDDKLEELRQGLRGDD